MLKVNLYLKCQPHQPAQQSPDQEEICHTLDGLDAESLIYL